MANALAKRSTSPAVTVDYIRRDHLQAGARYSDGRRVRYGIAAGAAAALAPGTQLMRPDDVDRLDADPSSLSGEYVKTRIGGPLRFMIL